MAEAIVGREAELGAIERLLRRVPEATAALLIEGEAGIGKTTVWLEAVHAGHARGFQVLELRLSESEAQLSYVGLADLLDGVFDATRAALPNVQERALAAALLREKADRAADPRTTATALVAVLAQLAASGPVLLAIDDVQWLDSASERALSFAARRLPPRVGLLLTRRVEVPSDVPLGLERAGPEGWVERVVPGPLSLAALHHVIKGRLGWSLPRPLLARLLEASGGNPFFALEIARALGRDAAEHRPGDPLPVPRNVEELVAARLRRLSDTARQASLAAAALSRPTPAAIADAVALGGDGRGHWSKRRRRASSSATGDASGSLTRSSPRSSTRRRRRRGVARCTSASRRSSKIRRSVRDIWRFVRPSQMPRLRRSSRAPRKRQPRVVLNRPLQSCLLPRAG